MNCPRCRPPTIGLSNVRVGRAVGRSPGMGRWVATLCRDAVLLRQLAPRVPPCRYAPGQPLLPVGTVGRVSSTRQSAGRARLLPRPALLLLGTWYPLVRVGFLLLVARCSGHDLHSFGSTRSFVPTRCSPGFATGLDSSWRAARRCNRRRGRPPSEASLFPPSASETAVSHRRPCHRVRDLEPQCFLIERWPAASTVTADHVQLCRTPRRGCRVFGGYRGHAADSLST
jgi:hypothetical protein